MKQFDFDTIGKQMPYSVPDGFFDKLEENVMQEVSKEKSRKSLRIALRAIVAVAAAVAMFFVVQPMIVEDSADDFESVELAFNNLSVDDQNYLLQVYEEDDLFINP